MQSCKWMHSYVFFNCLLKLSARTEAKLHWLHLYAFSPKGVFRCFLKSPAWTDDKSHWLHLNDFSPEEVFRCFLKSPAWIDGKSQMVALVCFFQLSPQIVCPNRCKVAFIAFVCFSQVTFQMCPQVVCLYRCKVALVAFVLFSPEWVFKCVLKLPACTDA